MRMKEYLKKKIQLRYKKSLVQLKTCNYFKNMAEKNHKSRIYNENIDETRN